MQKLQCEVCGGNELVKEGEYFVCQHCGTKYTKESLKEMMKLDVKVEVNDKHWEEVKEEANAEAEQLDYEISLIEKEFKPFYHKYVKDRSKAHDSKWWAGIICLIMLPILLIGYNNAFNNDYYNTLVQNRSFFFNGKFQFLIYLGIFSFFVRRFWTKSAALSKLDEEAGKKRNELREKITLIPEKFWSDIDVVRDYYKNWGATNQRDLLNHLEEHFRKPDVITRTVVVEK